MIDNLMMLGLVFVVIAIPLIFLPGFIWLGVLFRATPKNLSLIQHRYGIVLLVLGVFYIVVGVLPVGQSFIQVFVFWTAAVAMLLSIVITLRHATFK